jgi:hypothetical protein
MCDVGRIESHNPTIANTFVVPCRSVVSPKREEAWRWAILTGRPTASRDGSRRQIRFGRLPILNLGALPPHIHQNYWLASNTVTDRNAYRTPALFLTVNLMIFSTQLNPLPRSLSRRPRGYRLQRPIEMEIAIPADGLRSANASQPFVLPWKRCAARNYGT